MITISPGHWHVGTGAVGLIDEVAEARKVVTAVTFLLKKKGIPSHTVVDIRSKNLRENLAYLVRAHNETTRKLDVSVHFNASSGTRQEGIGTEVLYKDAKELAQNVAEAISKASGLKNRGAKQRQNLAFLNGVKEKAVLIEVCFVNSEEDVALYRQHFKKICQAIANVLAAEVNK